MSGSSPVWSSPRPHDQCIYVFPGHVAPRVAVAVRPAPAQTRHGDFAIRDWLAMLSEDLKHSGPARETDREEPPETPGPSQPLSREVIDDVLLIADTLGRRPVRSDLQRRYSSGGLGTRNLSPAKSTSWRRANNSTGIGIREVDDAALADAVAEPVDPYVAFHDAEPCLAAVRCLLDVESASPEGLGHGRRRPLG